MQLPQWMVQLQIPQNNTSPAGLEHHNIYLNSTYDQCTGIVSLNWNPILIGALALIVMRFLLKISSPVGV